MKVILLEDVVGKGNAGEVVEVKSGFARNKLIPSGIAIEADKTNMKTLEHRRAKIAAKKTADKEMAQSLADQLEGKQVEFTAKAGDAGKLFGSVTAHDIAEAVKESTGFEIDRRKLLLDSPLKEVGMHDVRYRIYPEVEATIKVNVLADGAPVLPPVDELKDTYADEALENASDEEFYYGGDEEKAELEAGEEAAAEEANIEGTVLSVSEEADSADENIEGTVLSVSEEADPADEEAEPVADETEPAAEEADSAETGGIEDDSEEI